VSGGHHGRVRRIAKQGVRRGAKHPSPAPPGDTRSVATEGRLASPQKRGSSQPWDAPRNFLHSGARNGTGHRVVGR